MLEAIALFFDPIVEPIRAACRPHYIYLKFFHVFFVMIWSWSTAVAYIWYVRLAFRRWERRPDDPETRARRDFAMEQFDRGVVLEHIAFPIIVITGPLLFITGNWRVTEEPSWLLVKLAIVIFIFLPLEGFDYWLSHFGGNKPRIRKSGDMEKYQRYMGYHWLFLRIATPLIGIFVPLTIFLAIVKPF